MNSTEFLTPCNDSHVNPAPQTGHEFANTGGTIGQHAWGHTHASPCTHECDRAHHLVHWKQAPRAKSTHPLLLRQLPTRASQTKTVKHGHVAWHTHTHALCAHSILPTQINTRLARCLGEHVRDAAALARTPHKTRVHTHKRRRATTKARE